MSGPYPVQPAPTNIAPPPPNYSGGDQPAHYGQPTQTIFVQQPAVVVGVPSLSTSPQHLSKLIEFEFSIEFS